MAINFSVLLTRFSIVLSSLPETILNNTTLINEVNLLSRSFLQWSLYQFLNLI